MNDRKKLPIQADIPENGLSGMGFDEALSRLLQTNPKDLADEFSRVKRRSSDIERSASERRSRLRAAIRGK